MKRREKTFGITCPKCNHKFEENLPTAIFSTGAENEKIKAGDFAGLTCPSCGNEFILNYRFAYTDEINQFMIVNDPAFVDRKARLAFSTSLGLIGSARKDELIKHTLRVTHNYDMLREKIAILEAGLDDKVVELMKYFLINSDDFAYKAIDIKEMTYKADGKFYLTTQLNVGLSLDFSNELYNTIVNNYKDLLKKDMELLVDRAWAEKFLTQE